MQNRRSKIFALLLLPLLARGNEREEASAARQAFEKVEASASIPVLNDLQTCIQAQVDAEKATPRNERGALVTRRVYCEFLKAALANDGKALAQSAAALEAVRGDGRNDSAPVLRMAAAIAALKSGTSKAPVEQDLAAILPQLNCLNAGFVHTQTCNALDGASRLWLGWLALNRHEWKQAESAFHRVDGSPWNSWLTGVSRAEGHEWREASMAFANAEAAWPVRGRMLTEWLGPRLAPGELASRLAYAQVMAGEVKAALPNLDAAIAARPNDAPMLFYRGLLRASLPDLEAAVKNAPADQLHFYQAVLLERKREYPAAVREFAQAGHDAADLEAWKSLANAAAGVCAGDAAEMDKLSAGVSAVFPRDEYALQIVECRLKSALPLNRLMALDASVRSERLVTAGFDQLRAHFAAAYLRAGVQAEDRKDSDAAMVAYRRALEWTPRNTKPRFNLGALFFGEQKFDLAEKEYRELLLVDPNDREAQFWLGQSILAAKPDEIRKGEACALLQTSIKIQDSKKRDDFAMAISTSSCAK